jgi:hypothetical protein
MVVRSAEPKGRSASSSDEASTLALAGVGAGAVVVAALADPASIEDGPVLCPFRLMTGLPCPGCGLTRSWVYLVHGEWSDAVAANPFGFVTLGATIVLMLWVVQALVRRRPLPSLARVVRSRSFKAVVTMWIGFAIVRLAVVAGGG